MPQFAVIGLGRFGKRLAINLTNAGAQVIAIDKDHALIDQIKAEVTLAVVLDSTDEEALKSQGVDQVDAAVVSIGDSFEDNLLTTVTLKQIGVERVIARATSETRGQILKRIGADDLVNPENESADRWSQRLFTANIKEQLPLGSNFRIIEVPAPAAWIGSDLKTLDLRNTMSLNIILIKRPTDQSTSEEEMQFDFLSPTATMPIESGDLLLIVGKDDDLKKLPQDE